jgi:hypothetical protein
MFLGFYQLGDRVPLRLYTRNATQTPSTPDAAPVVVIYGENGAKFWEGKLPLLDQERQTGYFHRQINLDSAFTSQRYTVFYTWKISSVLLASHEEFEVMGGGDANGAGIAMNYFRQQIADYVLLQDDNGVLNKLRGPEVRNAR